MRQRHLLALLLLYPAVAGASGCASNPGNPDSGPPPDGHAGKRFGVHLGSSTYASAAGPIAELGRHIFVRNEVYGDVFGWKVVKATEASTAICKGCCDVSRSPCGCAAGDAYYCTPGSRAGLLETPILVDFRRNDFTQLVTLGTSRYDDTKPKDLRPAYPRGKEDIYRAYVSFLVQGFGAAVKYWEVGNENDGPAFWAGTPAEYAGLVVIASEEVRKNCGDCKVGISFAHPDVGAKSMDKELWFAEIGAICSSFDFVDAHYYAPSFIEQGQLDRWKRTCPGKEFVSTETGVPDADVGTAGKPQNAGGTRESQAQDLIKYNTRLFAEGYGRLYWYLLDTDYGSGALFLTNGLINEDWARKPAFAAYKTMIGKVDNFSSLTALGDGQYRYVVNGAPVYVLWCETGGCRIPAEIAGSVRVTDHVGNQQVIEARDVVLGESPVFVER